MTIVIFLLVIAVLLWVVLTYNRLIRMRNQVAEAWAGIDVQLLRRCDLIPNLVKTVKGYQRHEAETLEQIAARRTEHMGPVQRSQQENELSVALGRLFALAEAYPELKASEGFQQLHQSLVDIENDLQYARRYYNGSVRDNNNLVEGFPSLLVARLFAFKVEEFFEIELASQRLAPEINMQTT